MYTTNIHKSSESYNVVKKTVKIKATTFRELMHETLQTSEYQLCATFTDMLNFRKNEIKSDFDFLHIANERIVRNKQDMHYIQKLKRIGTKKGAFDYFIYSSLCNIWIEFKTYEAYKKPNHNLSNEQLDFVARLQMLDIPSLVTYDPEEAFKFVQKYF